MPDDKSKEKPTKPVDKSSNNTDKEKQVVPPPKPPTPNKNRITESYHGDDVEER